MALFNFITFSFSLPLQFDLVDPNLWGLDILDSSFNNRYYYNLTGKGVNVYIVDSLIDKTHVEFNERMKIVYKTEENEYVCNEHGTHVAGIIGGKSVGVAKNVNLFSVQVINCGNNSDANQLVRAFEWILKNHVKPAIINFSMGVTVNAVMRYQPLEKVINNIIDSGIHFVNAIGNFNSESNCLSTPAIIPGVINVAASNRNFKKSDFSNWGDCVDFYAPGESIYSSIPGNNYGIMSGTSQATPFVTGVIALYLEQNPDANLTTIISVLQNSSMKNSITNTNTNVTNFFIQSIYVQPTNDLFWLVTILVAISLIVIFMMVLSFKNF